MKPAQENIGEKEPVVLRASKSAYYVFTFIFGGLFLLGIAVVIKDPSVWMLAAISFLVLVFFLFWLRFFRVILSEDAIIFRTLFGGTASLKFLEIERAELRVGYLKHRLLNFNEPPFRLVIEPQPSSGKRPLVINIKLLGYQDLRRLLDTLAAKVAGGVKGPVPFRRFTSEDLVRAVHGDFQALSFLLEQPHEVIEKCRKPLPELVVTRDAVRGVLLAFLTHQVSPDLVRKWASFVRYGVKEGLGREPIFPIDIDYDPSSENQIGNVVSRLTEIGDLIDGQIQDDEIKVLIQKLSA